MKIAYFWIDIKNENNSEYIAITNCNEFVGFSSHLAKLCLIHSTRRLFLLYLLGDKISYCNLV